MICNLGEPMSLRHPVPRVFAISMGVTLSFYTYGWVVLLIWMSHMTHITHTYLDGRHVSLSCAAGSHIWISRVTHLDEDTTYNTHIKSYVWHDSFMCVSYSYVWQDFLMRDMTNSYVRHDSIVCVT